MKARNNIKLKKKKFIQPIQDKCINPTLNNCFFSQVTFEKPS